MSSYHRLTEQVYLVGSGDFGLSHYCDCNVYLLVGGDECALVDAGAGIGTDVVIDNIRSVIGDLSRLRYVLLTHAHADHAGGIHALKQATGVRVVASRVESELLAHGTPDETGLTQAVRGGIYPAGYTFTNVPGDIVVESGEALAVGRLNVVALVTPGHTLGSTCYLVTGAGDPMLFSGDEVSWGGLMRLINMPGSDLDDYRQGVQVLANRGIQALFPSHRMWTLKNGQGHVDKLIASFQGPSIPPMPARIERIIPRA